MDGELKFALMIHAVTLLDFSRRYIESRDLSSDYAVRLHKRAAALSDHAGESIIAQVLSEPHVNAFLASLGHLSPFTVKSYREDLLSLWLAAADEELAPMPRTRRLRSIKTPEQVIECFTHDEAKALLEGAAAMKRKYPSGVLRSDYWSAAIRLAWDSGIRRGDVWKFRRDFVRPDLSIHLIQSKTKKLIVARLRKSTVTALDVIGRPLPCLWGMDKKYFGRQFKLIVKKSGVNRGTFRWIRRASGSYVELLQPGSGHKHLGNDRRTFERNYDAKLNGHDLPMPPALD